MNVSRSTAEIYGANGDAEKQRKTKEGRKTMAEMYLSFAKWHEQQGDQEAAAEYREKARELK